LTIVTYVDGTRITNFESVRDRAITRLGIATLISLTFYFTMTV